jgi:CxxC-x17-CxxC domain-containing protein
MIEASPGSLAAMPYEDKTLSCRDCHQPFIFSAGEQEFFASKDLQNEPKRCPNCRVSSRLLKEGKDLNQSTELPCDQCGVNTRVPFKPTRAKPVYCSPCLQKRKAIQIVLNQENPPND